MLRCLNSIAILIFSVHTLALVSGNKCPPAESIMPCRCRGRNDQVQVWCSHSDLERVNGALENLMRLRNMPAIDELIVENNRMPTLPARAFGALQIGRLLLRNNGLEGFSRNAFAGLEDSLEELYIVEEKLVDFPFDAIEKLKNLEAFTLEHSRVRLLPRFNGLNRLKHIRIDGSLISGFPVGAFANMAAVKQIHVVNSQVTTLAEGIFGKLENLVLANFSLNKIDHVQKRVFALLPRLEILSISDNLLEETVPVGRAVEELISLKSLDLSNNRFRHLPEGAFVNLRTLQSLNLAGNTINRVSMRSFSRLPALRKVSLNYNEIRNFPKHLFDTTPLLEEIRLRGNYLGSAKEIGEMLETMKSLRFLDISENGLAELPTGAIRGHTHLMKLILDDNKIVRIGRDAFKDCPSLQEISIKNNSLVELPLDGLAWDIPSLIEIDLSINKLTSITQNALQGLPNLSRMNLNFNAIKSLGQNVFSKNKELEHLSITDNGITVISSEAFNGLTKLTSLDLSANYIETIPSGALRDLKSLQILKIENNRLNNIPPNLFQGLKSLEELSLEHNFLNHIPAGLFVHQQKLKIINLKSNAISSVQSNMFSGLRNLDTLKLASNKISNLDDSSFDDLNQLKSLDLSGNSLTRLKSRVFNSLNRLERFEARTNKISTVEPGFLLNAGELQILDLAHNSQTQIPDIVKAESLKVVDLSFNKISEVPVDTFRKSTNLMELYLNDNSIKQLHPKTFENLGSLTIIDLDGNEIDEIKTGTFRSLPRLIYLRISRNKLRKIHPHAFSNLQALDGLDLQLNLLESSIDGFDRTGALKYLNISGNNYDSMTQMGLSSLSSLEVLDMSFNRLSGVDAKALSHLIWLVELRINDNGICIIPPGTFDSMSRLKMLVLKNNFLTHLYESVFYKLRNNIAFIDVSGNPLSCDCEMIWLRNLMAREAIQELSDSICDGPNELQGVPLKAARPGRMICSPGVGSRGLSNSISDVKCPPLTKSRRKPRPNTDDAEDHPLYGNNNAYPEASQNELRHNNRRKSDKIIESNDYVPGDTPTIYAGSSTSTTNTKATQDDVRKSNSVFGGLSSLFGIPFDFGLNLGISPSVSVTDKSTSRHSHVGKNGFSIDGTRKGSDPLPPSWIDRPTKPIYEPPVYHPSKPAQPYIPLNPFRENSPPVVPSGSVDVHKAVSPNGINDKDAQGRRKKPIVKFPSGPSPPPPASWHPSYPSVETGFIPIEPFFHSNSFFRNNKNAFQQNQKQYHNKTESNRTKSDGESSGSSVQYFSSTTQLPPPSRTHVKSVHQHNANSVKINHTTSSSTTSSTTSSSTTSSSTSTTSRNRNSAKKTGAESDVKRPFKTFPSPTDSRESSDKADQRPGITSSSSASQSESEEYNEDETSNYTPVDIIRTPDEERRQSEEKNKDESGLSLTDFFDIFTGKPIKNIVHKNNNNNNHQEPPKAVDPPPQYYDDQIDFANPIDATPIPDHYPNADVKGTELNLKPHKGKVTKIIEQDFSPSPQSNATSSGSSNSFTSPDNSISNELDGPRPDNEDHIIPPGPLSPQPLIPPVVIGSKDHDADWYYQNYQGESAMQSQEWEKLIEKNRIKSLEEELVGAKRSSSSGSRSIYSSASLSSHHYCLASLLFYLLVYMNP